MSEEKIIQHAHKAVHIAGDKEKPWLRKIKELAEEIAIIVFAVSITLAFHNWNDRVGERKIEKEFLTGASEDLKREANGIDESTISLNATAAYYDNVWHQISTGKIDKAYIDTNSYQLINTNYFYFGNGRFEGFKSSGYLRLIESKTLALHITTLYTSDIPFEIQADNDFYRDLRNMYTTYVGVKAPIDSNKTVHVSQIINDPAVKHLFAFYGDYIHERIRHKKQLANKMRKVAGEIDEELKK